MSGKEIALFQPAWKRNSAFMLKMANWCSIVPLKRKRNSTYGTLTTFLSGKELKHIAGFDCFTRIFIYIILSERK